MNLGYGMHAMASIQGVEMACTIPSSLLERALCRLRVLPTTDGDMACNTLPYKIAALRDAHLVG